MKNITLYALIAVILAFSIINIENGQDNTQFQLYKQEFQKKYHSHSDQQYRKLIFIKNKAQIQAHNSDPEQTYKKGINQFTDMTVNELQLIYSDFIIPPSTTTKSIPQSSPKLGVDIDWAQAGKVWPVIDQGQCGASWAFSAAGAFQSAHMIKNNNIHASTQELLDCTTSYGNFGCSGGYMSSSFKYIKQHNLHQQTNYPYTGNNENCKHPTGKTWTLSSYTDVVGCDGLLNAISLGPVSVAVDLSNFYDYKSGIVTKCGTTPTSGSLLIGVTDTYWRLKQSFGTKWGENGYFRLARGNTCAVCSIASYPTI